MSDVAYKSAEQVRIDNEGKEYLPCLVQLSNGAGSDAMGIEYSANSSCDGGATAWTYKLDETCMQGSEVWTVKIRPIPPDWNPS